MFYRLLLAACLLRATVTSYAQFELSTSTFTDRFQDELKQIYKPGHSYVLTLGAAGEEEKTRFGIGFNLGYGEYLPQADTFYTYARNEVLGYRSYSKYQVYQASMFMRVGYAILPHVEPYVGLEYGYNFTRYSYAIHDSREDDKDRVADARSIFISFAGINIPIGRFSLFAQTQYTFSTTRSNRFRKDDINFIWSNGVGVRCRIGEAGD